jgi:dolichyl-phosphate beta-glucosyltransferase
MELPLIVAVSLALVATYVVRQVLAFWARLDKDSSEGLQLQIEDPSSVKPLLCPSIWGTATKRLSVVVPAYNEEDRLPATLDETLAYLQRRRNKEVRCDVKRYCHVLHTCSSGHVSQYAQSVHEG